MKKSTIFTLSVVLFSQICLAQPPEGAANSGDAYGEKVDKKGVIAIQDLSKKMGDQKEMTVTVEGVVAEVCTKEGCWLKLQTADGKIMVKMKDHKFLVPVAIQGKKVLVSGEAVMKVTSVAELKHYAEDAGKTKAEIDAITEPKKEIVINAKGIVVL